MRGYRGVGVAIGVAMGTTLGVALHDIPLWVTLGAACGVGFGRVMNGRRRPSR